VREFSIPALAEIPATANLADAVFRRAAEQPRAVVVRRPDPEGGWRDVTAAQFKDEVTAVAKGLVAAGIEAGDRVALMSHTRYEWTLIDYAIWVAGAVTVPVYETSSAEQAEWILTNSGARACFVETADYEQIIESFRDQVPALKYVWRIEPGGAEESPLTGGGTSVGDEVIAERASGAKASDVATVIYTSGTTGRPKGCELTHENLLSDVRNAFLGPLTVIAGERDPGTLLFLPLAHVFARIIEVGCIEGGIVLGHWPDAGTLLPALASFRPTFILAVPRVFERVYNGAERRAVGERRGAIFGRAAEVAIAYSQAMDTPGAPPFGLRAQHALFDRLVYGKLRAALGGRAHYAVSGGAALTERLCHFFRGVGVTVLEGYGLTETTGAATVNRPERNKIGTVGQPLPGGGREVARARCVTPVGHRAAVKCSAAEPPGQPVMRQQHASRATRVARLMLGQPAQLSHRERGRGDAASSVRPPPRTAELSDQLRRRARRPQVVPEQGGPDHLAGLVYDHHAVLLRGHPDRVRAVEQPGPRLS